MWNKLTKALRDSVIEQELKDLNLQTVYFNDDQDSVLHKNPFKKRLQIKTELFGFFEHWVSNMFYGFNNLPEKYITNGNTDALNLILLNNKYSTVYTLPHEYAYYSYISSTLKIPLINFTNDTLSDLKDHGIVCLSVPASFDGEIESKQQIIDYCQQNNIPLFIDVAYCGLTEHHQINIKNTPNTFFAFSFSKTLSLAFNRIGVLYTGQPVVSLSIMNKLGYVNLSGAATALSLMKKIPCNYVYENYKDQYFNICTELKLTPTKCILFGHDTNKDKFCTTEYFLLK